MKEIPLSKGLFAIVDDDDYELVSKFKWWAMHGYAVTEVSGKTIYMHQLISAATVPYSTDHKNRNPLDNRKGNLRPATRVQNSGNSEKWRTPTSSRFKGVSWHKGRNRWQAYIIVSGKFRSLGYFDDEVEAAKAYNKAAIEVFGKFANPNPV